MRTVQQTKWGRNHDDAELLLLSFLDNPACLDRSRKLESEIRSTDIQLMPFPSLPTLFYAGARPSKSGRECRGTRWRTWKVQHEGGLQSESLSTFPSPWREDVTSVV